MFIIMLIKFFKVKSVFGMNKYFPLAIELGNRYKGLFTLSLDFTHGSCYEINNVYHRQARSKQGKTY